MIIKNLDNKIDYYKGCPPFPNKEEEKSNYSVYLESEKLNFLYMGLLKPSTAFLHSGQVL